MVDKPLRFEAARVKTNPSGVLKGNFRCVVEPYGVRFVQGKKLEFVVPVGTPAEHVKGNVIRLHLPEYQVEMNVANMGSFQKRLAVDVARFLSGQIPPPQADAYKMPPWFWVLGLAPAGILVAAGGGAIPGMIAGGLVTLNLALLQNEEMPLGARIAATAGITVVGYAAVIAMVVMALQSMPR